MSYFKDTKYEPINPNLILDQGEKICTECNGWGYLKSNKKNTPKGWASTDHKICPRCLGKCSLEFIDAIMGKNQDPRWAYGK